MNKFKVSMLAVICFGLSGCGSDNKTMDAVDKVAKVVEKSFMDESYDPTEDFYPLVVSEQRENLREEFNSDKEELLSFIFKEYDFLVCTDYKYSSEKVNHKNEVVVTLDTPRRLIETEWLQEHCSNQYIKEQTRMTFAKDSKTGELGLAPF